MSMPFNTNSNKLGPIEVFEDNTHFLVRIHPQNRDRAKKIVGRQWDGDRKAWVYSKDPLTYEALIEEFQKNADSFNIRRPKTKRPTGIKPPVKELGNEESDNDEFEDRLLEEIRPLGGIDESQEKVYSELEEIREMLGSLRDFSSNQSRILEEFCENHIEKPIREKVSTKTIEVLPRSLDLNKQREIELFEEALITLACSTAKQQISFREWVRKYKPLRDPSGFVMKTHEFLKRQLGKLVGDENPYTKFDFLIRKARNENFIYRDEKNPADKPISILFTLNDHRNCFGHSYFDELEERTRAIIYLMNLALVWSKIVIEVEDSDE